MFINAGQMLVWFQQGRNPVYLSVINHVVCKANQDAAVVLIRQSQDIMPPFLNGSFLDFQGKMVFVFHIDHGQKIIRIAEGGQAFREQRRIFIR